MNEDLHKFLFLGVMISVVMFSSRNFFSKPTENTASLGRAALTKVDPPVFALTPPENGEQGEQKVVPLPLQASLPQVVEERQSAGAQVAVESEDGIASRAFIRYRVGPLPDISAQVALVGDMRSGEIFLSRNPEKRWPLASITKLMTAAVVSREMSLNQSITLEASDFRGESEQNASNSSRFTVEDLRKAMLLASSNESAEALARVYGRDDFLAKMNANAREWGLANTFFDDPIGLSSANQSTAVDLLKLAGIIYNRYPEIFRITKIPSAAIADLNSGKKVLIKTTNNFASRADFLGGKTGYTDEASGNLLSVFSYKGRPVVIVVLGTEDRFGDTEKLLSWFKNNFK